MLLQRKKPTYPTKWRRCFAYLPVQIGEDNGRVLYIWLSRYKARRINESEIQRRCPRYVSTPITLEPWWT